MSVVLDQQPILVAGAGPAGLVAALLLHRLGAAVTLIGPAAGDDPRTTALMSPSIRLLDVIGVWTEDLKKACAPLRQLHIVDDTGHMIEAPPLIFKAEELDLEAFGWNVPLGNLVPALQDHVCNRGLLWIRSRVAKAELRDDDVRLLTEDGTELHGKAVIAADGVSSLLRTAAGIGVRHWSFEQSALVTQFDHSGPHHDTSTEWHRQGGVFTTVPMPGNRSSLVWLDKPAEIARIMALPEKDIAREIQLASHGTLGLISNVWPCRSFPMQGVAAETYAARRVFLVGEASHVFPPVGAQGLNMSFRDVGHAVEQMLNQQDPGAAEAISSYNSQRAHDVEPRQLAISAVNYTLLAESPLPHALRAIGLRALTWLPALRNYVMREGLAPTMRLPKLMQG